MSTPTLREALQSMLLAATEARWPLTAEQMLPMNMARAALAALAAEPTQEPVAWMRSDGFDGSISTMTVCISDKVRDVWLKANPKQIERYTIPLYTHPAPPQTPMTDAAEMLWVVLANVSGGDWSQQTPEWQAAAARWRDNYFAAVRAIGPARGE